MKPPIQLRRTLRLSLLILAFAGSVMPVRAQSPEPKPAGHYLFAWTGDAASKGNDFLAVINADLASPEFGPLVTKIATDLPTLYVALTVDSLPASGMPSASDMGSGRPCTCAV